MVGGTQGTTSPGLDGGGVLRVPPEQVWMVGGIPPPMRQSSTASTCYAAGGVPLAFTQEDFLVINISWHKQKRKLKIYGNTKLTNIANFAW